MYNKFLFSKIAAAYACTIFIYANYDPIFFVAVFGSGSASRSSTFWVEAKVEAIFENHLEAEALVKKKLEAEAEAILKKFGWKRKRKRFFSPSGSGSGSF